MLQKAFNFKIIDKIVYYRMSADLLSNPDTDSSATQAFLAEAHTLFDAAVNSKEISDTDRYWLPSLFQAILDEYMQLCPTAIGKLWISL